MKDLFRNFTIFIALSVVFSSLLACPSANTQKGPVDEAQSNANTAETNKKDDKGYPSPPAAIAQAEIKMLDGKIFKLEEQKGKVILFNLWGIWCVPCIREMPHLIETQDKYRDKNFEIIGLNIGDGDGTPETEEAIKEFAAKHKLNYQLGYADRKLFEEFARLAQLGGVPISILINREGKVTGVFTGGSPPVISKMKETVEKNVIE